MSAAAHGSPSASDARAAVDQPPVRANLDHYHARIGEGNMIDVFRGPLPIIRPVADRLIHIDEVTR